MIKGVVRIFSMLYIFSLASSQMPEGCPVKGEIIDEANCTSFKARDSEGNVIPNPSYKCCLVNYYLGKTEFKACSVVMQTKKEFKEYKKMLKDAQKLKIICSSQYCSYTALLLITFLLII